VEMIINQETLLETMLDLDKLKMLLFCTVPVFLEIIKYDSDGITRYSHLVMRMRKIELFEEGLTLLYKLPKEERLQALKRLKNLHIPSRLWYKTLEENNVSSNSNQTQNLKEPIMSKAEFVKDANGKNPGEEGYIETPNTTMKEKLQAAYEAGKATFGSSLWKTVGWTFLGIIGGAGAAVGYMKYTGNKTTAAGADGSGE